MAPVLSDLEVNHLRRFSLTWELLSKHLYQVISQLFESILPIITITQQGWQSLWWWLLYAGYRLHRPSYPKQSAHIHLSGTDGINVNFEKCFVETNVSALSSFEHSTRTRRMRTSTQSWWAKEHGKYILKCNLPFLGAWLPGFRRWNGECGRLLEWHWSIAPGVQVDDLRE